jgi:short-subunit dehydrogenase
MPTTNILITGGSSGIGAALARVYAKDGKHLILWGRDATRLSEVAAHCRDAGSSVETAVVDLRDIAATSEELIALDARRPLDLAILNAGLGGTAPADRRTEAPERVHDMVLVNFASPLVSATVIAELMAARGKGQIVLMSSVAGSFPLPMAPTYSASKAGLNMFAEALDLRMARHGVAVTLIAPGFIDTPMSRSVTNWKPFLMTVDDAARIMARKIDAKRRRIVLPWPFAVIRGVARLLPQSLSRAVLRRQ